MVHTQTTLDRVATLENELAKLKAQLKQEQQAKEEENEQAKSILFNPKQGEQYWSPLYCRVNGWRENGSNDFLSAGELQAFRTREDCKKWCEAMTIMDKYRSMGVPMVKGRAQWGWCLVEKYDWDNANKITQYNGIVFDSMKECRAAQETIGGRSKLGWAIRILAFDPTAYRE